MQKAEAFVRDQLPMQQWRVIPQVLRTAYRAVDELMLDTAFLQAESAQDNRGRLISFAVDYGVQRAIENGSITCDYRWVSFHKPTGRYLQLRFSHSTASISQVRCAFRQPRPVVFRENARLRNQGVLELPGLDDDQFVNGFPDFLIVHGYQDLYFAHLSVPSADSQIGYEWQSPNLLKFAHEIESSDPAPEDTDYDVAELTTFKEEIQKWSQGDGFK